MNFYLVSHHISPPPSGDDVIQVRLGSSMDLMVVCVEGILWLDLETFGECESTIGPSSADR